MSCRSVCQTLLLATLLAILLGDHGAQAQVPLAKWKLNETTVVEGSINGVEFGRRSLKRWDDRNCWWIDLPEPLCKKAGLETGDKVTLVIRLASEDLPNELTELLKRNSIAKASWEKLTKARQRMLREEIFAAKSTATRTRRAEKILC